DHTTIRAFQDYHLLAYFIMMMPNMFAIAYYFKVFSAVVFFIPILVMDTFTGIKKPAKVIFNYNPVFENIALFCSTRMFRNECVIVFSLVDDPPNLPHRTLLFKVRCSIH